MNLHWSGVSRYSSDMIIVLTATDLPDPVVPAITLVLYVAILGILIYTQPDLAKGAGAMLGAMLVAGVITARRKQAGAA